MPTIDQRDITLTETGRQTVDHDIDTSIIRSTIATGHSLQIRNTTTQSGAPLNGELARHEVRIIADSSVKGVFLLDSRSSWSGDTSTTTWTITEDAHTSTPAHSGPVQFVMPSGAQSWTVSLEIDSGWLHVLTVGAIALDSRYTVEVDNPTAPSSNQVKFTFRLKLGTSVKFSGEIVVNHASAVRSFFTASLVSTTTAARKKSARTA